MENVRSSLRESAVKLARDCNRKRRYCSSLNVVIVYGVSNTTIDLKQAKNVIERGSYGIDVLSEGRSVQSFRRPNDTSCSPCFTTLRRAFHDFPWLLWLR